MKKNETKEIPVFLRGSVILTIFLQKKLFLCKKQTKEQQKTYFFMTSQINETKKSLSKSNLLINGRKEFFKKHFFAIFNF